MLGLGRIIFGVHRVVHNNLGQALRVIGYHKVWYNSRRTLDILE